MSSAENVCDVHLVKTIPRKAGHAFLQRLTGWAREFGRSTVGHLSTSLLKCKCTHPCSGGYCHWTVLQSPSLSIFKKISSLLFHGYYWNISCSGLGWIVEAFFLLVVLLGKPILILTLSHLPRLSMAWDKTGTREEILQVSLSFFFFFRTMTLDRRVADGMRKGITGSAENSETVEAGDWKTSMDERGFLIEHKMCLWRNSRLSWHYTTQRNKITAIFKVKTAIKL